MNSCFSEFRCPAPIRETSNAKQRIDGYPAVIMLVCRGLDFEEDDYKFCMNQEFAEELQMQFEYPEERCSSLSK